VARLFHLDEQQHQLGDLIAVIDAVVAQHVAEVPELLDDVVVNHGYCLVDIIGYWLQSNTLQMYF
jgi:hypothetical protein